MQCAPAPQGASLPSQASPVSTTPLPHVGCTATHVQPAVHASPGAQPSALPSHASPTSCTPLPQTAGAGSGSTRSGMPSPSLSAAPGRKLAEKLAEQPEPSSVPVTPPCASNCPAIETPSTVTANVPFAATRPPAFAR